MQTEMVRSLQAEVKRLKERVKGHENKDDQQGREHIRGRGSNLNEDFELGGDRNEIGKQGMHGATGENKSIREAYRWPQGRPWRRTRTRGPAEGGVMQGFKDGGEDGGALPV